MLYKLRACRHRIGTTGGQFPLASPRSTLLPLQEWPRTNSQRICRQRRRTVPKGLALYLFHGTRPPRSIPTYRYQVPTDETQRLVCGQKQLAALLEHRRPTNSIKTSTKKDKAEIHGECEIRKPLDWSWGRRHSFPCKKCSLGQHGCFLLVVHIIRGCPVLYCCTSACSCKPGVSLRRPPWSAVL